MKIIEDLKEKILIQQEALKAKEIKGKETLTKLLRENKMELGKKNRIINKLYNIMTNISAFMNKIKMDNFNFSYDGGI